MHSTKKLGMEPPVPHLSSQTSSERTINHPAWSSSMAHMSSHYICLVPYKVPPRLVNHLIASLSLLDTQCDWVSPIPH